ncbi:MULTISPECIES: hypothetical protein [unclassified Streptomyces]|uniref:allene oxide cyclase barrel-like domain-containing protein n=1 Tax=unclassified Streptomyces TaxID=2593676 RepID=UPI002033F6EF|nr:hypothetical protein [Streptomyces sp. RKAG290]MCM2410711.1 hypothetical protein [Streptomyces sp. RKAG290]
MTSTDSVAAPAGNDGEFKAQQIVELTAPPFAPEEEHPAVGDPANVLWLADLNETLLKYESNNEDFEGKNPTPDDFARVEYELRDADGNVVGTTKGVGRMLYKRPEDGHHIAYFSEEIRLNDGTVIRTGGLVDDVKLTEGEQATIPAVGIAGPFRGAVGFRQFKPVETHKSYLSQIVLYRR